MFQILIGMCIGSGVVAFAFFLIWLTTRKNKS